VSIIKTWRGVDSRPEILGPGLMAGGGGGGYNRIEPRVTRGGMKVL